TYTLGGTPTYSLSQALAIGTAQTHYITLDNTSTAALNAQQYSPMIEMGGSGNASTTVTSPEVVKAALQVQPQQGSSAPDARIALMSSINGVAYSSSAPLAIFTTETSLFPNLTNSGLIFGSLSSAAPTISGGGNGSIGLKFTSSGTQLFYAGATATMQSGSFAVNVPV